MIKYYELYFSQLIVIFQVQVLVQMVYYNAHDMFLTRYVAQSCILLKHPPCVRIQV